MVQLVGSNSLGLSKVINGKTQYVHIKYSAYEDGMIMTDTVIEDTKFMGVLVTFNPQSSPMPGDYSWARFIASDGKDAELLVLNVSTNIVRVDRDGNIESERIEIVADVKNTEGEAAITAIPYIGKTPQQPIELGGAGNSRFLYTSSWSTSWDSLILQSALGELRDVQTIVRIFDGQDGTSNYNVVILSTEGDAFKNGVIETTLVAKVYYGDQEVTEQLDANRFRWSRSSIDKVSDSIWNSKYFSGTKEVQITTEDVHKRATFSCDILGE